MTDIEVIEKKWIDFGWLCRYEAFVRKIGAKAAKSFWVGVHKVENPDHPKDGKWTTYTVPIDYWPVTYHDTLEAAKREAERQVEEMLQEVRDGTINWWSRHNKCPYCGKYHVFYLGSCPRQSMTDFKHRWDHIPEGIDNDTLFAL